MPIDPFQTLTRDLRELGGQRVWSLMVSLFGDLAQDAGSQIAGPRLSAIMTLLDVRPEAARVALHRLRNDDWITSQKSGRTSLHSLTAKGRAESAAASPRIYADPNVKDQDWQCLLLPQADPDRANSLAAEGFTALTPRLFFGPDALQAPADSLPLSASSVPEWLQAQLEPKALKDSYAALLEALDALMQRLPPADDLDPIRIAVLRCLIVHNWRRLVLKHPALPSPLVSPDWVGLHCHQRVHDLLQAYPRPTLQEIAQQANAA